LDTLHRAWRGAHIVVGFAGLVLFWVPIFAKKGGRLHVVCGRLFVWCAYIVGATSVVSSAWAVAHPVSFLRDPLSRGVSERSVPYMIEQARFFFSILGFLGLAVLVGTYFGVRVVRTRRDHAELRRGILIPAELLLGAWCVGVAAFGAYNLATCAAGRHLLPAAAAGRFAIPIALGLWGLHGVVGELNYILRPRPTPRAWWYRHMEAMIGAGIAFHTAFLVFGSARLFGVQLPGPWQVVPWLLPSAIGIPAAVLWVRYYKRRFKEDQPSNSATVTVMPGSDGTASVAS
jgi:hypothetical protein